MEVEEEHRERTSVYEQKCLEKDVSETILTRNSFVCLTSFLSATDGLIVKVANWKRARLHSWAKLKWRHEHAGRSCPRGWKRRRNDQLLGANIRQRSHKRVENDRNQLVWRFLTHSKSCVWGSAHLGDIQGKNSHWCPNEPRWRWHRLVKLSNHGGRQIHCKCLWAYAKTPKAR